MQKSQNDDINEEVQTEEEVKPETEVFNKPDFVFMPKGNHEWRQEGPYLVCRGCSLQHAVWIGMEKIMIGMDEKGPIIKRRIDLLGKQA